MIARRSATLVLLVLLSSLLNAQGSAKTPVSGTVVDPAGHPVADATVVLTRQTFRAPDHGGMAILASGKTDAQGRFSFGDVALRTEMSFPLETGVLLEFAVSTEGNPRLIEDLKFTAPRFGEAVTSVTADIEIR